MEKSKNLKEVVIKIEGKDWNDALDKAFRLLLDLEKVKHLKMYF